MLHYRDHIGLTEEKIASYLTSILNTQTVFSVYAGTEDMVCRRSFYLLSHLPHLPPTNIGHSLQLHPQILVPTQQEWFFNKAQ